MTASAVKNGESDLHGINPVRITSAEYASIRRQVGTGYGFEVDFTDDHGRLRSGIRIGDYLYAATGQGPMRYEVRK